ncbi:MAG TPA: MdtA/MuxA family multidrug efflux RND transporter periplasmic adaptor subunit [Verrucomicrobiae bacterium]|jgi:membrane fusion protein, multidrug efflux system|nr:MdtA/MuxA family multidrug efflux RND transporter periplasmic adaptor subunit [Verrucomicrobiae bacterium]
MGHLDSIELPERGARDSSAMVPAKSRWWLWVVVLGLIAVGIWYYRGTHATSEAGANVPPGGPGKGGPGGYFMTGPVPVVVSTAQKGDLPVYLIGLGSVAAFNTVTVRSRVDGQIVKVNFTEGQFVHEGDALIEIDPRPYQVMLEQAEGQLAKDQAQLHDVQVDFERYTLLYNEGVIPKQQVDTQQAQVGQFQGSIKADQATIDNAKLQLVYARITAPISGRVGLRLVDIGNIVHATDTTGLLVITQLQPISVIFTLPQDQLQQVLVKLRGGGQLPVQAFDRDDTTKIADGKLATIDNQIDPTTGTYKLKAIFSNENNVLFPNQFVNVHMLVDTKRNVVIVPAAAIQRGPQGTYVYVVSGGNTVSIRSVTIAQTTGNNIGISSGLNAGEVVVIDGQDKLQDKSEVITSTAPAGGSVSGDSSQPSAQSAGQSNPKPSNPASPQSGGKSQ